MGGSTIRVKLKYFTPGQFYLNLIWVGPKHKSNGLGKIKNIWDGFNKLEVMWTYYGGILRTMSRLMIR